MLRNKFLDWFSQITIFNYEFSWNQLAMFLKIVHLHYSHFIMTKKIMKPSHYLKLSHLFLKYHLYGWINFNWDQNHHQQIVANHSKIDTLSFFLLNRFHCNQIFLTYQKHSKYYCSLDSYQATIIFDHHIANSWSPMKVRIYCSYSKYLFNGYISFFLIMNISKMWTCHLSLWWLFLNYKSLLFSFFLSWNSHIIR